ncbi:MAG: DUF4288 domain-containing protein [Cyclobacteriaceae bacterium]|nr:DUF4288 domain-containing protein [Cyclobacteriaceae bacterium]
MNWYVAKIVFRITPVKASTVGQFDEHLRLIRAESLEQAFIKARLLGIREEDEGNEQSQACWEFVNVSELMPLGELCDGAEVYSQVHEVREAGAYIQLVHQRASSLTA